MKVPQIDIKGIFEKAAGHKAELHTRTVVVTELAADLMDQTHTLSGKLKPASFSVTPPKRREQFFA